VTRGELIRGAPYIISVAGTAALNTPRTFNGTGAPASGTLSAGNGMYNGIGSGFIVDAVLVVAGAGYSVGNVLQLTGGTSATALQLTVDAVNGSGAITDFHVSAVGNYSVYPGAGAGVTYVTGGSGTGATFSVTVPAADYYIDITTLTAPVLYVCTTGGITGASVWAKVSGGGGSTVQYFAITALSNADSFTAVPITITYPSGTLTISFGSAVSVAKLNRMRPSIASELIDGVTIGYSSYSADNLRTASDGTNTESQVAFPRYTTATTLRLSTSSPLTGSSAYSFLDSQCVVKCVALTAPVGTGSSGLAWEEITPRVWARQFSQSGTV
jgi:hypothetical protein